METAKLDDISKLVADYDAEIYRLNVELEYLRCQLDKPKHDREQILQRAVEFFGQEHQINMAIEEMAELTQALCKHRRDPKQKTSVLEEMADVQIMMDQLKIIFGNPESDDQFKLERLKGLIERGEFSA